ncbi:MAG: hypothetical protein A2X04_06950 [Bacteroidetes bacterium GWF2_41_9]|nr:MAG: hypothetical protein A2X04_06950 [Bacteroidetes bacterium GWF2_41_9]
MERFSVTDFNNVDSLITSGYIAALPFKDRFRKLADSLNSLGERQPTPYILDKSSLTFDKIEINGNSVYSDDQITMTGFHPDEQHFSSLKAFISLGCNF